MKKVNVLDLLCDDLIEQTQTEDNNISNCIDKDKINYNSKTYIIPFLNNHYQMLDLDFDYNIYSQNDNERYKSLILLLYIIKGVYELIGIMPDYYKQYEKEYGIENAYNEICLRVIIGNILDIKKGLNKITISNQMKKDLDDILQQFDDLK